MMNNHSMFHPLKILFALLMAFPARAEETTTGVEELPGELGQKIRLDAGTMATEWNRTLRAVGDPGGGEVPLSKLIRKLMPLGFAKVGGLAAVDAKKTPDRWVIRRRENDAKYDRKFIKSLQRYSTGHLTPRSFARTIESLLADWPNKLLLLDANADGKIALAEYALSRPLVQDQEIDPEGYSETQRRGFAYYDADNNGFIEGTEIFQSTSYVQRKMRQYMTTLLIPRADLNQDSTLSRDEILKILPEAEDLPHPVSLSEAIFWIRLIDSDDLAPLRDTLLEMK